MKDTFHIFTPRISVLRKLFRTRKYLYISYVKKEKSEKSNNKASTQAIPRGDPMSKYGSPTNSATPLAPLLLVFRTKFCSGMGACVSDDT